MDVDQKDGGLFCQARTSSASWLEIEIRNRSINNIAVVENLPSSHRISLSTVRTTGTNQRLLCQPPSGGDGDHVRAL